MSVHKKPQAYRHRQHYSYIQHPTGFYYFLCRASAPIKFSAGQPAKNGQNQ